MIGIQQAILTARTLARRYARTHYLLRDPIGGYHVNAHMPTGADAQFFVCKVHPDARLSRV